MSQVVFIDDDDVDLFEGSLECVADTSIFLLSTGSCCDVVTREVHMVDSDERPLPVYDISNMTKLAYETVNL